MIFWFCFHYPVVCFQISYVLSVSHNSAIAFSSPHTSTSAPYTVVFLRLLQNVSVLENHDEVSSVWLFFWGAATVQQFEGRKLAGIPLSLRLRFVPDQRVAHATAEWILQLRPQCAFVIKASILQNVQNKHYFLQMRKTWAELILNFFPSLFEVYAFIRPFFSYSKCRRFDFSKRDWIESKSLQFNSQPPAISQVYFFVLFSTNFQCILLKQFCSCNFCL